MELTSLEESSTSKNVGCCFNNYAIFFRGLSALYWEANRDIIDLVFRRSGGFGKGKDICLVYDGFDKLYTNVRHAMKEVG
jgi:hypothetical protein